MGNKRSDFLNKNVNEKIMTCGELKTLEFHILDKNLDSFKNSFNSKSFLQYNEDDNLKNSIEQVSLFKNTKKGTKAMNKFGPNHNSTEQVKIRPGSRILKVETMLEYRELIARYLKKEDWDNKAMHSISSLDFKKLSNDYEGIYLSKEVSSNLDRELILHSPNTDDSKENICKISRVIILNPNILVDKNETEIQSYRKGVSGKIFNLSRYNRTFSEYTFNNIKRYSEMQSFFSEIKNKDIIKRDDEYYLDEQDITKKVYKLINNYTQLNNNLNSYGVEINTVFGTGSNADIENKKVSMDIKEIFDFYNDYINFNLKYNKENFLKLMQVDRNKDEILNNISEAIALHELGHVNNNNVKKCYDIEEKITKNINTKVYKDKTIYYVDKKFALEYMRDNLHTERLAWDYAFKQKPNCKVTKWVAYMAYSSYINYHIQAKNKKYINWVYNEKKIKLYMV